MKIDPSTKPDDPNLPKGFHNLLCDLCGKVTIHYKEAGGSKSAECKNHSKWDGKKHVVVNKESNHIIMLAKLTPDHELMTERELRNANRMDRTLWRSAEEKRERVYMDMPDIFADSIDRTEPDPTKHYCSFCGTEVEQIQITTEKRPKIRISQDVYRDADGEVQIREKVHSIAEEVKACPNCVLKIRKPIVVRKV